MHQTPKRIFEEIARTRPPCERAWILRDHVCQGRSTMEHAWIYAGRQINDAWAIIRLCEWSHLGKGLDKEINHWISLQHATSADFAKYPRKDWEQLKQYLNAKYGKPKYPTDHERKASSQIKQSSTTPPIGARTKPGGAEEGRAAVPSPPKNGARTLRANHVV